MRRSSSASAAELEDRLDAGKTNYPRRSGETPETSPPVREKEKHPRLSGENLGKEGEAGGSWETPPPKRGKHQHLVELSKMIADAAVIKILSVNPYPAVL